MNEFIDVYSLLKTYHSDFMIAKAIFPIRKKIKGEIIIKPDSLLGFGNLIFINNFLIPVLP